MRFIAIRCDTFYVIVVLKAKDQMLSVIERKKEKKTNKTYTQRRIHSTQTHSYRSFTYIGVQGSTHTDKGRSREREKRETAYRNTFQLNHTKRGEKPQARQL